MTERTRDRNKEDPEARAREAAFEAWQPNAPAEETPEEIFRPPPRRMTFPPSFLLILAGACLLFALEPTVAIPHVNRAQALLSAGRADEALAATERAITLEPKFPHGHLAKARVLSRGGQTEAALAAVDQAVKLAPQLPEALKARASLLTTLGRTEEAEAARATIAALGKA